MTLSIYNTLSRKTEEFTPLKQGEVGMYACGITVYDESHIGHASQAIIFDVIRNYLEYCGNKVRYVRNFTDIDDKIIAKANQTGKQASEVSEYYIQEARTDLAALKVKPASIEPKVTENVPEIISFIQTLIDKGSAYESKGDVLFDVAKFEGYGKLSHRKTEDMISEETPHKHNPADFSLWKAAKPGEPSWPSPWGPGRPGWHIECSVMASKFLGETLDIHGGGVDLVFPHHENEIAQSEALSGRPFARFWIHNGLVMVNKQKMSKSLGNFYTIKAALKKFQADVIRFIVLSVHYSSNIDFAESSFHNASKRVYYFYKSLIIIDSLIKTGKESGTENLLTETTDSLASKFQEFMNDDFNTARVIALLSDAFKQVNELIENKTIKQARKITTLKIFREKLTPILSVLNILNDDPNTFASEFKARYLKENNIDASEIEDLIGRRNEARKNKDFQTADQIRHDLLKRNILLNDTPNGTEWEISTKI